MVTFRWLMVGAVKGNGFRWIGDPRTIVVTGFHYRTILSLP